MYGILLEINKIEKSTKYSIFLFIWMQNIPYNCKTCLYGLSYIVNMCMVFHIVNNYHKVNLKISEAKKLRNKIVFIVLMNNLFSHLPLWHIKLQ